jgi:MFS family permease
VTSQDDSRPRPPRPGGSGAAPPGAGVSAWAPLRRPAFRTLWFAQLGSNVGTWMQTVGAQWMLVHQPHAATLTSAVQAASLLPVLFLSLPAGVLADVFDRRTLLMVLSLVMAVISGALTALTAAGLTTPAVLIALTFLLGCAQALTSPGWQAIQPELVPRDQIPAAAALGSLNVNVARAVGPAVAGLLIAVSGTETVFAINAVSFVGVLIALLAWRRAPQTASTPERLRPALASGTRYVRNAPGVRRLLLRAALFVLPASALWGLLPVVSQARLGLSSGGYGLLLAALGTGSIAAAVTIKRIRTFLPANSLMALSTVAFALGTLAAALLREPWAVAPLLFLAGVGWLYALSTLNTTLQLALPAWVRARGLAVYLMVFLGGQGVGALVWGAAASALGTPTALLLSTALLVLSAASLLRLPLRAMTGTLDRGIVAPWPEPALDPSVEDEQGPVLIEVTYLIPADRSADFKAAMAPVAVSRRRTGALRWSLFQDRARAEVWVEIFEVPSWSEHLRQHEGRMTAYDAELLDRAKELSTAEPEVRHLLLAPP